MNETEMKLVKANDDTMRKADTLFRVLVEFSEGGPDMLQMIQYLWVMSWVHFKKPQSSIDDAIRMFGDCCKLTVEKWESNEQ